MAFTKEQMVRIHELAKEMEGDYVARLALAFREVANVETPALVGSEKQVAWATEIKAKMLKAAVRAVVILSAFDNKKAVSSVEKTTAAIETLINMTSAKWFIENREQVEQLELLEEENMLLALNKTNFFRIAING
ncbi:MAG: hypothetical protein ACRCZL_08735 [Cetobacterium sp.]